MGRGRRLFYYYIGSLYVTNKVRRKVATEIRNPKVLEFFARNLYYAQ
jgi:hypothetical protein